MVSNDLIHGNKDNEYDMMNIGNKLFEGELRRERRNHVKGKRCLPPYRYLVLLSLSENFQIIIDA